MRLLEKLNSLPVNGWTKKPGNLFADLRPIALAVAIANSKFRRGLF